MPYAPPLTITSRLIDLVSRISEAVGRWEAAAGKMSPRLRRENRIRTIIFPSPNMRVLSCEMWSWEMGPIKSAIVVPSHRRRTMTSGPGEKESCVPSRVCLSCGVPKKVRELVKELQAAGFRQIPGGGKGFHRKFVHERFAGAVTLSGAEGADAKVYQEKQIKRAIEEVQP